MRGKNVGLVGDPQLIKRFYTTGHCFPIGRAAHDDGDER